MSKKDFVSWTLSELEYELRYQQADGIHTVSPSPHCGHLAGGSGFCAKCLQKEIERRKK